MIYEYTMYDVGLYGIWKFISMYVTDNLYRNTMHHNLVF